MKKVLSMIVLLAFAAAPTFAQHVKRQPGISGAAPAGQPHLTWPGKAVAPLAPNPFGVATQRPQPHSTLQPLAEGRHSSVSIIRGENGLPIYFEGATEASGNAAEKAPMGQRALEYCNSLHPQGIAKPASEFTVKSAEADAQGNTHVRLEQVFNGLPVWGGEVICHTQNGAFERMNGRYFPTPQLASTTPVVGADQAISRVKTEIGAANIKTEWSEMELKLIDGQPFAATLIVYHVKENLAGERLAWHVAARPNVLSRTEWFVDAITGEILDHYDNTCNLAGHLHLHDAKTESVATMPEVAEGTSVNMVDGPVTINGADLLGVNRSFTNGGWQAGSTIVMEDASKSMFNAGASTMPADPVGAIVTADAGNTSPENQNFNVDLVVSNTTTINNTKAISAHYNSEKSFDYYKTKHSRNSIDGVGGNVIGIVNVSESDGTSMENAFWNGQAMFYGNGGSTFKPLARGLDVGGHEMTHGVVEKTANLVYQGESGALNESFADIFGQMIDGDANDWKIGEDVMQSGGGLPTALRDMANPHNGQANSNSPFWQPQHTNEQYTGSQDNGGVHVNSGITNRAFYLFASNASVGTAKAELVYYKALKDYLVKSSKFVDCRIAVIQAATDLYGASVANIAADAFTQVGIGGSTPGGNYLGQLSPNPGTEYIVCVSNNGNNLDLTNGSGQVILNLYNQGVKSRASVTDNGASIVFVNTANQVIGLDINYQTNPISVVTTQLSDVADSWRNAVISKDGRFVAGILDFQEPRIYIFDLADPLGAFETFFLYNPTYSTGQITGDVEYADVLEFDYSGQFLMYDSYNSLDNIGYWDIGFVQYWENGQFTDGGDAFITKLFTGLPEKVSIGNPAFAKNSPYIIAFDLIDETSTVRYDVYGANSETGDYDIIVANNGDLGWPNFNRLDNKLLYEKANASGYDLRLQGLNPNKIQPQGGSSQIVSAHYWGALFANGTRSLVVGTDEANAQAIDLSLSPNPTADWAQMTLRANAASGAVVSLHNLLGETVMTRSVNLVEGENKLDIDLQHLPAGNYVLRVAAENGSGAALKVVKN